MDDSLRDPDKYSDDLILEYSRKDNESVKDYSARLLLIVMKPLRLMKESKFEIGKPNPE